MHTHNASKADILAIFQKIGTSLGIDYFQYHSPLNEVQLKTIINELLQEDKLMSVDKYHWKAK